MARGRVYEVLNDGFLIARKRSQKILGRAQKQVGETSVKNFPPTGSSAPIALARPAAAAAARQRAALCCCHQSDHGTGQFPLLGRSVLHKSSGPPPK
eukprot:g81134.t1